jgi:hypothetical protein
MNAKALKILLSSHGTNHASIYYPFDVAIQPTQEYESKIVSLKEKR